MVVAAIAAEYNPFHNGHAYHVAQTRAAGATHIVAVMSGNYTQRGTPAIAEKHVRAHGALVGGVDLVVELPLPYAMATAQRFAFGAVGTAAAMGCVNMMSFGSESGYLSLLSAAAKAVDSPAVCEKMSLHLDQGLTFARARQLAVSALFGDEVGDRLGTPNDALAVEYLRNISQFGSGIEPFAVLRHGAGHDTAEIFGEIASASYLRGLMRTGGVGAILNLIPDKSFEVLCEAAKSGHLPFDDAKIEPIVFGVLRKLTAQTIAALPDISEGLENRIYAAIRQAASLSDVYRLSKSKRYTSARIRRVIMAAFLSLDKSLCTRPIPYIHVLGFNAKGREILSLMRSKSSVPVSDSMAYLRRQSADALDFVDAEALSTDLYRLGLPNVLPCGYDFTVDSVRL